MRLHERSWHSPKAMWRTKMRIAATLVRVPRDVFDGRQAAYLAVSDLGYVRRTCPKCVAYGRVKALRTAYRRKKRGWK